MSAYENLTPAVRDIIDRKAAALAERDGITVEQAREELSGLIRTLTFPKPNHGTGH